jgi:hypothetical protein
MKILLSSALVLLVCFLAIGCGGDAVIAGSGPDPTIVKVGVSTQPAAANAVDSTDADLIEHRTKDKE